MSILGWISLVFLSFVAFIVWQLCVRPLPRLFDWLGLRYENRDPLWLRVKELLATKAKEHRLPCPELLVLPEFSPNALVLHDLGGKTYVVLSEGLIRSLSAEELETAICMCLAQAYQPGRMMQTSVALLMVPIVRLVQSNHMIFQVLFFPFISLFSRLVSRPKQVFKTDTLVAEWTNPHRVAQVLQKLNVASRKISLRRWNLALDHLYLLSPTIIEEAPFWALPNQPTVDERRDNLLRATACESSVSLS